MSCQTTTVARSPRQAPRDCFQFFPGVVAAGGCIFSEGQFRFFLSASSVSLSPRASYYYYGYLFSPTQAGAIVWKLEPL